MGAPWTYHSDPCDEHDAVRERAGLFDVSGLKKVRVRGSDAAAVCDHVITRDMSRIPYRAFGLWAGLCRMDGRQSATTPSSSPWPMTTSSSSTVQGACMKRACRKRAEGKQVSIAFDDDLHDISLQGPASVDFLDPHMPDRPARAPLLPPGRDHALRAGRSLISRDRLTPARRGLRDSFATAEHVVAALGRDSRARRGRRYRPPAPSPASTRSGVGGCAGSSIPTT